MAIIQLNTNEASGMTVAIQTGDTIRVDYTGTLENGDIFDTSKGKSPLKFTVGAGMMIKGFDQAVVGMNVGETKSVRVIPEEAYGAYDNRYVVQLPKEAVGDDFEGEVGTHVTLENPNGRLVPAIIKKIDESGVTVDINHPLAGKVLNFEITVVETGLEPDVHECGCGHNHDEEHECCGDHHGEDHDCCGGHHHH